MKRQEMFLVLDELLQSVQGCVYGDRNMERRAITRPIISDDCTEDIRSGSVPVGCD